MNIEIIENEGYIIRTSKSILKVMQWGKNAVKIFASPNHNSENIYGIDELDRLEKSNCKISVNGDLVELINKDLKVIYDGNKLIFYNKNKKILEEYTRAVKNKDYNYALNIEAREFKYISDNSYKSILRFEADENEKIYGMGSYQEYSLNKNFSTYELMHRNSQTTIPFYISNKKYGFIWNNASIGEVKFSKNYKQWESYNSNCIEYLVIVGENTKEIIRDYTSIIGRSPMINENLLGLWQSKLRYQTKEELEVIYQEYLKRNIDLSVLVIDYYHWTEDGEFEFDLTYWDKIEELAKKVNIMVSLWPTVSKECKYYNHYLDNKMLLNSINHKNEIFDNKAILDFFNPKTKEFLNFLLNKNYKSKNINLFWADQAEPEMNIYNHKEYETYIGNFEKTANKFPLVYLKSIDKKEDYPTLIRSAWFNSQKYGALVWSGDIDSSFDSLKRQIQCSISMGLSGISWFTTDIGGFYTKDPKSEEFKELLIRWFQFSTFSPILRMHGDRMPHTKRMSNTGGGKRTSGSENEIFSYGEEVENILLKYIRIREKLKKYILSLYEESSKQGYPIIRSVFFEYENDENSWNEEQTYMFGSEFLVVPILEYNKKEIEIYFPKGNDWINVFDKKKYRGGEKYILKTSLEEIPVFVKQTSYLIKEIDSIFKGE